MRKVITALCVLASVELTSDAVAQQWSEYRPADARFRVDMPGLRKFAPIPFRSSGHSS